MNSLSPEKRQQLVLSVKAGAYKRPLSPIEVAECIESLIAAGQTFTEVARSLQFDSTSTLREIHRLLRLAPDVRHLVGWRGSKAPISMSAASQISRLPQAEHLPLAEASIANTLTLFEVRQVVESQLITHRTLSECLGAILRLRPNVVRQYVFIGKVTSEDVRQLLRGRSQLERNDTLRNIVVAYAKPSGEWSATLGPDIFTIVGTAELASQIQSIPSGFEAAINDKLLSEVTP